MCWNDVYEVVVFFFKQKTAYEMRISDWSSDVCSSDLQRVFDDRVHLLESGPRARKRGPALSRFRNPPQARRKPVSKPGTVHHLRHPLGRKQQVDLMIGQRIQAFDIVFKPAVGVNCFADIITTERGHRLAITTGPLVPQDARPRPDQGPLTVL